MLGTLLLTLLTQADGGVAPTPRRLPFLAAWLDPAPLTTARAEGVLFADQLTAPKTRRCDVEEPRRARCLFALRYRGDDAALKLAAELYEHTGSVAGLTPEQDFDGGFRGTIHLVPDLPTGDKRKHLEWVVAALTDFDQVLGRLARDAVSFAYRWRALEIGFYRSVKRRTPAGWAVDWGFNYNTAGTLNWGPDIVRELVFHEVFHLNDQAHRDWSRKALGPIYDAILARCGTKNACLEPWAPVETVTKGTYYAFLPANGVGEYAAELATRYYRDQRVMAQGGKIAKPFKCRNKENAQAWALLSAEFFGGADLVPACPQ